MRILLADNDREVVDYIRKEFEDEGHSVFVCHDGAEALRAGQRHTFDIIILFMDGLEVRRPSSDSRRVWGNKIGMADSARIRGDEFVPSSP